MTPETKLKGALLSVLRRDFHQGFWFSSPAGPYARAGIPDVSGVCEGHACYFETKVNAKRYGPTPTQALFGRKVIDAGGFWIVADDPENASRLLNAYLVKMRSKPADKPGDTRDDRHDSANAPENLTGHLV